MYQKLEPATVVLCFMAGNELRTNWSDPISCSVMGHDFFRILCFVLSEFGRPSSSSMLERDRLRLRVSWGLTVLSLELPMGGSGMGAFLIGALENPGGTCKGLFRYTIPFLRPGWVGAWIGVSSMMLMEVTLMSWGKVWVEALEKGLMPASVWWAKEATFSSSGSWFSDEDCLRGLPVLGLDFQFLWSDGPDLAASSPRLCSFRVKGWEFFHGSTEFIGMHDPKDFLLLGGAWGVESSERLTLLGLSCLTSATMQTEYGVWTSGRVFLRLTVVAVTWGVGATGVERLRAKEMKEDFLVLPSTSPVDTFLPFRWIGEICICVRDCSMSDTSAGWGWDGQLLVARNISAVAFSFFMFSWLRQSCPNWFAQHWNISSFAEFCLDTRELESECCESRSL